MNQQGIRYCQWKSTLRLAQGLRGQTDLDVLVDRKHSETFRRLLNEHHLKPVLPAPGRHYPGIESYLGYDLASGKLFHLHIHYQLVLGEQFVKNYRLPVESYVLDWTELRHEVKVPIPELEVIILSIRALLKYRDRDAFKDIFSIRSAGLPVHILNEIDRLLGLSSQERLSELLAELADVIPARIVKEFLDTVAAAPRAGRVFFRLRREVRRAPFCG